MQRAASQKNQAYGGTAARWECHSTNTDNSWCAWPPVGWEIAEFCTVGNSSKNDGNKDALVPNFNPSIDDGNVDANKSVDEPILNLWSSRSEGRVPNKPQGTKDVPVAPRWSDHVSPLFIQVFCYNAIQQARSVLEIPFPSTNRPSWYWELAGNVLGTYSSETGFRFNKVPSAMRSRPHEHWSFDDLSHEVNDFSLDVSSDVLAVVEITSPCVDSGCSKLVLLTRASRSSFNLHILSLKTGKPHPFAELPQISAHLQSTGSSQSFKIRIYGQNLGVMTRRGDEIFELHVWSWKTGVLRKVCYLEVPILANY